MQIKKKNWLYNFIFYAQSPEMRPEEEDLFTCIVRFIGECLLVPLLTLLFLVTAPFFTERPMLFWEGSLYQMKRIEFSLLLKIIYMIISIIVLVIFGLWLYGVAFYWMTNNIEGVLNQVGRWMRGNILPLIIVTNLVAVLLIFRKYLPKVRYVDEF
jgi:hypothetical protein